MTSIKRDRVVTRNLTADESTYVVQAKVCIKAKSEVKRKKGGRGKQVIKELFTYRRVQSNRPGTRRWLSRLSASGKDHALRLKPLEVLIARTVDLSKIIFAVGGKIKIRGFSYIWGQGKAEGLQRQRSMHIFTDARIIYQIVIVRVLSTESLLLVCTQVRLFMCSFLLILGKILFPSCFRIRTGCIGTGDNYVV